MANKVRTMTALTQGYRKQIILGFVVLCAIIVSIVVILIVKNFHESQKVLEDSIEARMITLATAAREEIDPVKFATYTSQEAITGDPDYQGELTALKKLAAGYGARYFYALARINGEYRFIYDTDPEEDRVFVEYLSIGDVHKNAFSGSPTAIALGMDDDYGSFSTGVVPIFGADGFTVLGVMCADLDDYFVQEYQNTQYRNMITMIAFIVMVMIVMTVLLIGTLRNVGEMSDRLFRQANYDKLTNLPNRQYLMSHLESIGKKYQNYALFFIDLDNFKKVNDIAGHDAGDALLVAIGAYLNDKHVGTAVFRPTAGALNVAARIGGDEFILIAPEVTGSEAEAIAANLISGLSAEVQDKNIEKFNVGFSIGIALSPEHTTNYHVLLKYADIAMYHAKRSGKNAYMIYRDEMKDKEEK